MHSLFWIVLSFFSVFCLNFQTKVWNIYFLETNDFAFSGEYNAHYVTNMRRALRQTIV